MRKGIKIIKMIGVPPRIKKRDNVKKHLYPDYNWENALN